jgi:cytochrome c biogenesis protein CcdA
VFRVLGIVISIGLADSLNPTTIAPALYLASGPRARGRVLEFTLAVFGVYLAGGLVLTLGPGQLLISLIPFPRHAARYWIEVGVGVAVLVGASLLWRHRALLAEREAPSFNPHGRSSWLLGATITAIELPTAFPYFAAIAAIVGGTRNVVHEIALLVIFNVCFVLPLIGILATLTLAPTRSDQLLCAGRAFLQRHWPRLLAVVGVLAGLLVILLGLSGLTSSPHSDFGRFMRRIHRSLPRP